MKLRTQEELETLSLYGAKDFRSISKEKLMTFTSTLHEMHPEVAKAVTEQIPGFFDTCEQMANMTKSAYETALENGDKRFQAVTDAVNARMSYLGDCLNKAQTDEVRMAILKQMDEVTVQHMEARRESAKETDKEFNRAIWTFLIITCLAGAAVGVTSNLVKKIPRIRP